MSFSVDLWNGFEIIKNQFNTNLRKTKKFVKVLTGLINIEREYTKSIDTLIRENRELNKSNYHVDSCMLQMIDDIKNESDNRKSYFNYLNNNVINPLQVSISSPKTIFMKAFLENDDCKEIYCKSLNNLINKQETFHASCQELCYFLAEFEINKITNNQNKNHESRKKRIIEKLNKSKEDYILYLNETNIEREKYNEQTEQHLNDLEKIFRENLSLLQKNMLNYAIARYKFLENNFLKEKDHYNNLYQKLDLEKEISDFIIKNNTKEFPLPKIEFCPYKTNLVNSKIRDKYQQTITNKDFIQVFKKIDEYFTKNNIFPSNLIQTGVSKISKKNERRFTFFNKDNKILGLGNIGKGNKSSVSDKDKIIKENIHFIDDFINEIISLTKIKNEKEIEEINDKMEKNTYEFMKLITKDNKNPSYLVYLEAFIKNLSNNRSKGNFELTYEIYEKLTKIFSKILSNNKTNDYILKNIMILSQTFYYIDKNESDKTKNKIYIQQGIKDHEVFKIPETWHRVINYSLNLGLINIKDVSSSLKMTKEESIEKLKKLSFNTIISYLCDLKLFTSEDEVFENIKNYYVAAYNMNVNDVNNHIEEYFKGMGIKVNLNKNENKEKKLDNEENVNTANGEEERLEELKDVLLPQGDKIDFHLSPQNSKNIENNIVVKDNPETGFIEVITNIITKDVNEDNNEEKDNKNVINDNDEKKDEK